ncbi:MAG: hypothetical protein RMM29_02790 [Planctomycetota bacterium]|nr:hypothetical protein [Planctomycetota bacterium]MCX8039148.1 hypothetical protein [Planctomycetota bacterium]MDW8372560.1 hypothetical protein [Planctomycetota bacterium]
MATGAPDDGSEAMIAVLRAHRDAASGEAAVPREDPELRARIMRDAETVSREIRAARARAIPWWLWLAWILAIVAVGAAWLWGGVHAAVP